MSEEPPTAAANGESKADTGRAGIVLAGGRSERFPTVDKALAPLDGNPLLWHAVASVDPAVDELIVNCRRDQREAFAEALAAFPVRFAVDRIPDRGPVVGLRTALEETTATYAAVVPCDMPSIPVGFVDFLFARARNRTGAVARVDGRVQPFPAVVHVRAAAAACREAEATGDGRIESFVSLLDPHVVPERVVRAHVDPAAFDSINTHDDLARTRDR
ncbi:MAG: molybdenum cofactor guanylyltransferase [Halohasta sp.]